MNTLRSIFLRREAGIAVMIVLFCLVVGAFKPQFLTLDQLRIILLLTPLIMIAAMGQMMVIVARHVDLSIGSTLGVSAMTSGMLYRWDETWLGFNVPWWTGIPLWRRRVRPGFQWPLCGGGSALCRGHEGCDREDGPGAEWPSASPGHDNAKEGNARTCNLNLSKHYDQHWRR